MIKVAFICVHNLCRSQIAEAFGHLYGKNVFESYSAGTEVKENINSTVVRLMKEKYGVNLLEKQYPKLLEDFPAIDIVVTMGL